MNPLSVLDRERERDREREGERERKGEERRRQRALRDRGQMREHERERSKIGRDGNLCPERSVCTGPARGNTVDGLPRASKLKKGCQKIGYFGAKNGNISRSVNSFGTGAIFWPRLGQDLSGNAFVGPFLFSGQKNDCRKDFCMTHKMTKKLQKIKFF